MTDSRPFPIHRQRSAADLIPIIFDHYTTVVSDGWALATLGVHRHRASSVAIETELEISRHYSPFIFVEAITFFKRLS
ncbi:hypothetical protein QR680_016717 [Steinernema hermaphroditum]|uniref:Uncharacterized protein n=1 Tax=Steinernema hermaphroditum TaxID=289476 RepID=A0AA39HE88_9BILA|nr:hypothetical protein QR680_016717 [Steinernema hermaphroditum]